MNIKKASIHELDLLMSSRMEMLKIVNNLSDEKFFDKKFVDKTKEYFHSANQTSVLALDDDRVIGCATICYITVLPTLDHPTGKRAHIMNVYTNENYRRQGIAYKMMNLLISEAKENGVTEISLDSTESGRLLYEKCGFINTKEGMILNIIQ